MRNPAFRLSVIALLALPAAHTWAETATREGNIWGWRDHQPTEAVVQRNERAAGIAPTPSQSKSDAAKLDQLYQELLHRSPDR